MLCPTRALHPAAKIREGAGNFPFKFKIFLFDYFANSFFNIFCTSATFGHLSCVFDVHEDFWVGIVPYVGR